MNILIVYAHPEPTSLNGFLKDVAIQTFTEKGYKVKVSDLYEMNFKAVADKNDFLEINQPEQFNYIKEQKHASKTKGYTKDILDEHEKIMWADIIMFQFPIWWTDAPAILKGWFDRILSYNFAYGPGIYDQGNLKGKKALLSMTHGGPDLRNYGKYGIKGELHERLFNIQHEKLYFCGLDIIEPFIFSASADEKGKEELLKTFKERLRSIENEPIIPFHSITHYENGQLLAKYRDEFVLS